MTQAEEARHAAIRGREPERKQLADVVSGLRNGASSALVVIGEAGLGKTTLLDAWCASTTGCRIRRIAGVQSEMEFSGSGLHQLCMPLLGKLDRLPDAHRVALESAFGLAPGGSRDPFFLGLAVLGLLTENADDQPLVCIIDDAQWLDRLSAQVLAFVARRLQAESVALVFVVRERRTEFAGIEELPLTRLSGDHANALLDEVVRTPIDERVRQRVIAEARGNPLALIEFSRAGTGDFDIAGGARLSDQLQEGFLREVRTMPEDSQQLLLLAAAEPLGDPGVLARAADQLGLPAPDLHAEAGRLVTFGSSVRFRHPLVRSAIYDAAPEDDRRRAHHALAAATDLTTDPDRGLWHRAQSIDGFDDAVATELEGAAERARARAGTAAAGAFLSRSSSLTPDPAQRARRALAAAAAHLHAGVPDRADQLLAAAQNGPLSAQETAIAHRLRGHIVFSQTRGREAPPHLLRAVRGLAEIDVAQARDTLIEALLLAVWVYPCETVVDIRAIAAVARTVPRPPGPIRTKDLVLDAWTLVLTEGHAAGAAATSEAIATLLRDETPTADSLQWIQAAVALCAEMWDVDGWRQLTDRYARFARDSGALAALESLLLSRGGITMLRGDFLRGEAMLAEAQAISDDTGSPTPGYGLALTLAWRGERERCIELASTMIQQAKRAGEGLAQRNAELALLILHNSCGEYDPALEVLDHYRGRDFIAQSSVVAQDVMEAAVRGGDRELAERTHALVAKQTAATGTPWALGVEALCRALLTEDDDPREAYREAVDQLRRSGLRWRLARAQLLYGEWLRRQGDRLEAREQLAAAHEFFTEVPTTILAERAARELRATGLTSRRRTPEARDDLTPQERQIAELAAEGLTNREIGQKLFLSHRTIGSHLYRVYPKLGVTSRAQLARALEREAGR